MKRPRIDVSSIRKQQIVEAAIGVIAEQGLQRLSLSEIETRAGMSRGQLTYYYPTKEDIFLAVFDHMLRTLRERAEAAHAGAESIPPVGWERMKFFLSKLLPEPPKMAGFDSLQYTFLAQINHREDFRQRLADFYEHWRGHIAADAVPALTKRPEPKASPETFAALVQAIILGFAVQRAADPHAFDSRGMLELVLNILSSYLHAGTANEPSASVNIQGEP